MIDTGKQSHAGSTLVSSFLLLFSVFFFICLFAFFEIIDKMGQRAFPNKFSTQSPDGTCAIV